jgi:hypothetical protein
LHQRQSCATLHRNPEISALPTLLHRTGQPLVFFQLTRVDRCVLTSPRGPEKCL